MNQVAGFTGILHVTALYQPLAKFHVLGVKVERERERKGTNRKGKKGRKVGRVSFSPANL